MPETPLPRDFEQRVEICAEKRFGKAVIRGTRVAVDEVVGLLASGLNNDEVAAEFGIELDDVRAALAYASRAVSNERRWAQ